MRFAFPISKTVAMDDGRLLIEGVATSETLDLQGEILDYEGSKRAFEKWRGNLREAHDPKKPVGRALEVIPDDVNKTISVRAFISAGAQDTQEKVKDGTLSMFSVGGGKPTKTILEKVSGKAVRRVLDWPMSELSLVDSGANPDAAVSVLKAVGDEEAEKPPVEGEEKPKEGEEPPTEAPPEDEQGPEEKANEPVQLSEAQMTELVTKITDAVLASLEAKKKDDPATTPAATPEQKPPEKSVPEPVIKKTDGMAAYDIRAALDCLSGLEMLRSCESYEVMAGTPEPPEQLTLLEAAIKALKGFIASEAKELAENTCKCGCACVAGCTCGCDAGCACAAGPAMKSVGRVVIIKASAASDAELVQKYNDIMARFDALEAIQKSAPPPDPRLDDVVAGIGSMPASLATELSKTASDLKAAFSGEVKALREGAIAKLAKATDQILAMPVPGRSPIRNFEAARAQLEKSAPSETNKANVLRSAAQGAPPSVRDYLLNEASAIERS